MQIIDIRDKLPRPGPGAHGRTPVKTWITLHYNGPAVALHNVAAGFDAWLTHLIGIAQYHIQKNWAVPPQVLRGSGIMYHYSILPDGTICQMRDLDENLWHCANQTGNNQSLAIHFPMGGNQTPTAAQWHAFTALCDDLIAQHPERYSRERIRGHREWPKYQQVNGKLVEVPNSLCPGDIIMPMLAAWRVTPIVVDPGPVLPAMVYLRATVNARVRTQPNTTSTTVMIMPKGTVAGYDGDTPGEMVAGSTVWKHRGDGLGFTHVSLLEPA